jgi:hypothetical protein
MTPKGYRNMLGRLSTSLIFALGLIVTGQATAQQMPPGYGFGPPGGSAPAGYPPAGMMQAGYPTPSPAYQQVAPPGAWYNEPGQAGGPAESEHILKDLWKMDAVFLNMLKKPFYPGTWVRSEFLMWTIENPGNVLLGEQLSTVSDPRLPTDAFDNSGILLGQTRVPHLDNFRFRDIYGLRLTYGVPLTVGSLEFSVFMMEQANHSELAPELPSGTTPGAGNFVSTSTFVDGLTTNNGQRFDKSFDARLTSEVWGTNSRVIFDKYELGPGLSLNPLIGFRYLNVNEQLLQRGVYNNLGTQPDQVSLVGVEVDNNILGIDFGFQSEFTHKWLTLGIRPSVSLGVNISEATAHTERFVSLTDPFRDSETDRVAFSPVAELATYLKLNLTDSFTVMAGYNLIYITRMQRAGDAIIYDISSGPPSQSIVRAKKDYKSMMIDGLTVGCEWRFH